MTDTATIEKDAGETTAPARKALYLNPTGLQDASHFRNRWMAVPPAAATIDDVCQPSFWLHSAAKLRRMDIIEVLPEDEAWYAELLVIRIGIGTAKVKVLNHAVIDEVGEEPADFTTEISWGGPAHKYRVVRKSDKHVISYGHESKAAAMIAQADYERTLAR